MSGETIDGAVELRELAVQLKAAGERDLELSMRRGIRAAAAPAKDAIRSSAEQILPHGGGLNEWVAAATISTRILTGARTTGVALRVAKGKHDLADLDESGSLRHPFWGRRGKDQWADQTVTAGFASTPVLALTPAVEAACVTVLSETAAAAGFVG